MSRFIKICEYILFVLFFVLLFFMSNKLSTFMIIPLIVVIYFFIKKVKIKHFGIFIFLVALIVRIISVIVLKVDICDDFKTMYMASRDLINGNLSFLKNSYFVYFSYQLGHVVYQALLLKIINSVMFLKIINCIITSFTVLFIYLITRKIFSENISRFVTFSYLFYLYPLYLNSVLTNQLLPALLVLIVIYLLVSKKLDYKLIFICSLILAFSNVFRTESIVIILGIILYIICKFKKENIKRNSLLIVSLVGSYFIFTFIISFLFSISSINTNLSNNSGLWKFYCGLNYETNGIYNVDDDNRFFNSNDKNKLLIDRITNNPWKLPVLFLKKEVILWTQTNYDLRISNNFNETFYNFLLLFNQGFLNLVLLLFVISLYPRKNSETDDKSLLIKILIGVYYFVYMFIEISPRYAYILDIFIFLIIGLGIDRVVNFIKNKKKRT